VLTFPRLFFILFKQSLALLEDNLLLLITSVQLAVLATLVRKHVLVKLNQLLLLKSPVLPQLSLLFYLQLHGFAHLQEHPDGIVILDVLLCCAQFVLQFQALERFALNFVLDFQQGLDEVVTVNFLAGEDVVLLM
jgi:hypothetical protein